MKRLLGLNTFASSLHGAAAFGDESLEDAVQLGFITGLKLSGNADSVQQLGIVGFKVNEELLFEFADVTGEHLIQEASHTGEDNAHLLLSSHGNLH